MRNEFEKDRRGKNTKRMTQNEAIRRTATDAICLAIRKKGQDYRSLYRRGIFNRKFIKGRFKSGRASDKEIQSVDCYLNIDLSKIYR